MRSTEHSGRGRRGPGALKLLADLNHTRAGCSSRSVAYRSRVEARKYCCFLEAESRSVRGFAAMYEGAAPFFTRETASRPAGLRRIRVLTTTRRVVWNIS